MGILVVEGALFGMILGRFFKWPILVLAYGFAIALILASSTYIERSLFTLFPQIVVVIISLQFGYVVGIFGRKFQHGRQRAKYLGVHRPAKTPLSGAKSRKMDRGAT